MVTHPEEGKIVEIRVISELIEGENLFDSHGYSVIKITKDGEPEKVKIPIKSTGVAEYQRKLEGKAPRPPVTKELIKKGSKEGKALGLPHDKIALVFDTTDEKYVDAVENHNLELGWKVAIFALDMTLKKKGGTVAESYEDKKAVLQSSGITFHHINRILKDVNALTQFAEDREDFLSEIL
jgi:hypothetical protein